MASHGGKRAASFLERYQPITQKNADDVIMSLLGTRKFQQNSHKIP